MQTEFRKELEKNSSRLIEQADIIKQVLYFISLFIDNSRQKG